MALILTITNAGRAALRNADASGTRAVRIASVGVSAAALAATVATAALPGEIKRITTVSGAAVAADIIHLTVSDETMATYTVRSFVLYLDDGTLFAAYGQADPIIEKSSQALMVLTVDVTLADIAAAQITFGDANFLMPPATTERQGLIELATVTEAKAGEDQARGVTPATAKAAVRDWIGYDPANRAGDTFTGPIGVRHAARNLALFVGQSGTGYGFLQLGDIANPVAARSWHLGSQDDGSFGLYQGIWGSGTLRMLVTSTGVAFNGAAMWHAANDGAGSGLDADLLDGLHAAQLLRADQSSTLATDAALDFPNSAFGRILRVGGNGYTGAGTRASVVGSNGNLHLDAATGYTVILNYHAGEGVTFGNGAGGVVAAMSKAGALSAASVDAPVMRRGGLQLVGFDNDGAGSGLDADLLDGLQGSQFIRSDVSTVLPANIAIDYTNGTWGRAMRVGGNGYTAGTTRASIVTTDGSLHLDSTADKDLYLNFHCGGAIQFGNGASAIVATMSKTGGLSAAAVDAPVMRRGGLQLVGFDNDGAGSGLDADLLDGLQGSQFIRSDVSTVLPANTALDYTNGTWGRAMRVGGNGYTAGTTRTSIVTTDGSLHLDSTADKDLYLNFHCGSAIQFGNGAGAIVATMSKTGGLSAAAVDAPVMRRSGINLVGFDNDGAGSGLDADLLDGRDGDFYRRWGNLLDVPGAFPPTGHTHGAADLAGAFPGTLAENGYTVLPNGLILQWVTGPGMAAGDEATQLVYFPVAFPNACFGALAGSRDDYFSTAADVMFSTVGVPNFDSVTVARKQFSERASDRVPSRAFVIAIGR